MHRSNAILNPRLLAAVAGLGHGQSLFIVDPGFPIPDGPELIDLSLHAGTPSFADVLTTIVAELSVESSVAAGETEEHSPPAYAAMIGAGLAPRIVAHDELKLMAANARTIVRTGDVVPFSNIALIGGVTF
ncbi:D-ribose pyranase [Lysinimonas soli]|uniref:D-ribose pyranase n=1 Tax=Lysinimonas soli TaxID=1074233 RepID=A0ABW0NJE9_9MICO